MRRSAEKPYLGSGARLKSGDKTHCGCKTSDLHERIRELVDGEMQRLDCLTGSQREVVTLVVTTGLRGTEIALKLGIAKETVCIMARRARARLEDQANGFSPKKLGLYSARPKRHLAGVRSDVKRRAAVLRAGTTAADRAVSGACRELGPVEPALPGLWRAIPGGTLFVRDGWYPEGRMKPAPPRAPNPFEQFHAYMRGWRDGANVGLIRPEFEKHPTLGPLYLEGREAGIKVRREVSRAACERFDYEPSILRTADMVFETALDVVTDSGVVLSK